MASRSLGTLTLDLIAKIGGFEQGMDKAGRNAEKNFRKMRKEAQDAGNLIGKVFGVLTAGAGLALFVKNTIDAQNEQTQLAAVLRSTGEAAGYSQLQLNDMADGLARASTVSAGEITSAQTALLAFTGIVGEEFPRALQAAVDMAARTGTSVVSAAELVGRALDVPSKGLAALSKQGFRFTDEQKNMAEALEATGRTAEAQGIILEALETTYGGAARAARDTFGGALIAVREALNDLLEAGPGAVDPVTDSLNDLADLLRDPQTVQAVQTLTSGMISGFTAAANAIAGTVNVTKFLAESLAASMNGPALDDLVRVSDRLKDLQDARQDTFFARVVYKPNFATGLMTDEEIDAEIKTLQKALDDGYARLKPPALPPPAVTPTKEVVDGIVIVSDAQKKAAEAAKRAEESRLAGIESVVSGLEREAAILGKTAEEIEIYDLHSKNAAESDYERVRVAYGLIDAYQSQQDMLESINDQIDKNFEDWLETEKRRMEELLGLTDKTGDDMTKRWEHAVENMQDALADFLFDPFEEGLDGMLKDFGRIIQRMIAEAAAAQIFDSIIQGGKGVANSDGGWGSILSSFAGLFDSGGSIPSGGWGIAGEKGPEIVRGPAMVTGRMDTAKALSRSNGVTIGNMNFPGVTNAQEARRAAGAAAREISRVVAGSGRYA